MERQVRLATSGVTPWDIGPDRGHRCPASHRSGTWRTGM